MKHVYPTFAVIGLGLSMLDPWPALAAEYDPCGMVDSAVAAEALSSAFKEEGECPADLDNLELAITYNINGRPTGITTEMVTFLPTVTEGEYILGGLFSWCVPPEESIPPVATWDNSTGILTVAPGQTVIKMDGIDWKLMNCPEQGKLQSAPLFFKWTGECFELVASAELPDGDGGTVEYKSIGGNVCAQLEDGNWYTYCNMLDIEWFVPKSFMSGKVINRMLGLVDHRQPVKVTREEDRLYVDLWYGCATGQPIEFAIDTEAKSLTATGQLMMETVHPVTMEVLNSFWLSSAELTAGDVPVNANADGSFVLTAPYREEDGRTVADLGSWNAFAAQEGLGAMLFPMVEWTMTLDLSFQSTGIAAPTLSTAEQPRYYTLDGREVKKPAKGQLVVVNEGATVRKAIF